MRKRLDRLFQRYLTRSYARWGPSIGFAVSCATIAFYIYGGRPHESRRWASILVLVCTLEMMLGTIAQRAGA